MPPRKILGTRRKFGKCGTRGGCTWKRASRRKRVTHDRATLTVGLYTFFPLRPFDPGLLDLVQQGLVADAEDLRGLATVPVDLAQRVGDHDPLGRESSLPRDISEPSAIR